MEKVKNNLPLVLVSLSSILFVVAILLLVNANVFKSSNSTNSNDANSNNTKEINKKENNTSETTNNENTNNDSDNVEPTPVATPIPTNTPVPTPVATPEVITKSEEEVINYFDLQEKSIQAGDEKTFGEKAKEGFVNIVDFIFYDKEIKGHKFKELTNSAKLKIISIALKIDSKIDSYFPNYKDKIKGTYNNVKAKLVEKYIEYTQKLCDSVGESTCNQAKQDWEALKKSFSITGEYLKNLGITGTDKLKDWYENWRDK